jgi:hypothetical protein
MIVVEPVCMYRKLEFGSKDYGGLNVNFELNDFIWYVEIVIRI